MRPARARIALDALRHNYAISRARHGGRALAVVKANAYGHGAVQCARALEGLADGFAVAIVEEAIQLREAGVRAPILVLEGAFDSEDLALGRRLGLWLVMHDEGQLRMLEQDPDPDAGVLDIWLKLNSGMNRAGLEPRAFREAWQRLRACRGVGDIALMTHLARADEPDAAATKAQIALFDSTTRDLPGARSIANSAGILAWPDARRDWGRPGVALYGADPMPHKDNGLRPVMTLESAIMAVREVPVGAAIGYGARFVAPRDMRIGLVAMGYADGYPRGTPDGTPVAVDGIRTEIIGRVSMDMLSVDLSRLPDAGVGSRVELWGSTVAVNEVAHAAGTIAYELLCNVKRVGFEYA